MLCTSFCFCIQSSHSRHHIGPYYPNFLFWLLWLYLFVCCSGGAASCCGPWQVLCERTWTTWWGPCNGSCWIHGVRSGAFGHVDLTIQMYPNDPKCIYFYPRLTRCHSHPHIWLHSAGVLWAGSSGHKTEGRLGSKLQRLDLPAAWQMGCCAVWSWFGFIRSCTRLLGSCEDDGLSPHQQLRNKEAREILGMGGKWQDMARYNLLL